MGCGCKRNTVASPSPLKSKEEDNLSGKVIVDQSNRELLVLSPIYDSYRDIIGYITKDDSGNTIRIFSKNITKVLD